MGKEKVNQTQEFIDNPEKLKEIYLQEIQKDPRAYLIVSQILDLIRNIKEVPPLTYAEFKSKIEPHEKLLMEIADFREKNGQAESYKASKNLIFASFPEGKRENAGWLAWWTFERTYWLNESSISENNPFFELLNETCIF